MRIVLFAAAILALTTSPIPAADLERGRTIYAQICFQCHGLELDGGKGPALKDAYWQHGSSPEAILKVIEKGIPGTEMIGYEAIFPEEDRVALRDYILSHQEGLRETVRAVYPREHFAGKRLTSEGFDEVESLSQTALPENHYYFDRNGEGVLRGTSRLHIQKPGEYLFKMRPIGRTSIYVDGREVHYSDDKTDKATHRNESFRLNRGVYDLEILHEEKKTHSYRFAGVLQHESGKSWWPLNGRSLEGNIPKVISAGPEAKVIRKWIVDLPARSLLCLLPSGVLVAYDPTTATVLGAWHSAAINQTPSLPDRSANPSQIQGIPIPDFVPLTPFGERLPRFVRYQSHGALVHIVSLVDGVETTLVIKPEGTQSFSATLAK